MATTYKKTQIAAALERIQNARGVDSMTLKQLCCDARLVGASFKSIEKARSEANKLECLEILESGKCPHCGRGLKYNNALAGTAWYQCVGYGAEGFRQGEPCGFQMLWEKN